jgi:oligopeptide/dipeptide ABC transporter ATP-binding protein
VPQRDPRASSAPQVLAGEAPNPVDIPPGCRFRPRCPIAEDRCALTDPQLAAPDAAVAPDVAVTPAAAGRQVACLLAAARA